MAEAGKVIAALIRHGDYQQLPDTPSAHQPFPLTDIGVQQALACADQLLKDIHRNGWTLDSTIDTSSLLRAWQTASLIHQHLLSYAQADCTISEFDALAERGLGIAGNLSLTQVKAVIGGDPRCGVLPGDWKSNSDFRLPVPGAESLMTAGERVAAHLRTRAAAVVDTASRTKLKLFVGHGAAFRHAAYQLGVIGRNDIAQLSMHHAQPIYFAIQDDTWRHVGGAWKQRHSLGEAPD